MAPVPALQIRFLNLIIHRAGHNKRVRILVDQIPSAHLFQPLIAMGTRFLYLLDRLIEAERLIELTENDHPDMAEIHSLAEKIWSVLGNEL